jgi:hypothetical protein
MALTYVGGAVAAGTGTGNITCSLTALTGGADTAARTGDLVIAVNSSTNLNVSHTTGVVSPTGYTDLGSYYQAGTTYGCNADVSWKVMGATTDTSVVGYGSQSGSYEGNMIVHVWRNEDTGIQPDVTMTQASGNGTGIPNPPSCTPLTTGAVVLAIGCAPGTGGTITAPSGYGNLSGYKGALGTVGHTSYFASKAWSGTGSEDPGTFGGFPSSSLISWIGLTLVIRPAPTFIVINEKVADVAVAGVKEGMFPLAVLPSDVRSGVVYSSDGVNWLTGTLVVGGGASRVIGSPIIRRLK